MGRRGGCLVHLGNPDSRLDNVLPLELLLDLLGEGIEGFPNSLTCPSTHLAVDDRTVLGRELLGKSPPLLLRHHPLVLQIHLVGHDDLGHGWRGLLADLDYPLV